MVVRVACRGLSLILFLSMSSSMLGHDVNEDQPASRGVLLDKWLKG